MSRTPAQWIALANKLIIKNGRSAVVTITRTSQTSYSTTQLTGTDATPSTYQVYCAPIDYSGIKFNALSEKPEYNDTTSVKELYIPGGVGPDGKTYVPQIGDTVALDKTWSVLAVKDTYETQSTSCAYLLHIGA